MPSDEDNDRSDYDSGPFCQHWGDPADCDEVCATCGHRCWEHEHWDAPRACDVDGCECKGFKDKEAHDAQE